MVVEVMDAHPVAHLLLPGEGLLEELPGHLLGEVVLQAVRVHQGWLELLGCRHLLLEHLEVPGVRCQVVPGDSRGVR